MAKLSRLCKSTAAYFAVYARWLVTPILLIYKRRDELPSLLVKLSCRLISNTNTLTVFDKGKGKKRTEIVDGVLGELIMHKVLWLSPSAREILPASSGVVIRNARRLFLTEAAFLKVPKTCFWQENTLTGLAIQYIPNVTRFKLTEESLLEMGDRNWNSLGTTLIADAISGNTDRSSTRNLFVSKGLLWSIDNPFPVERMLQNLSTDAVRGI